MPASWGGSFDQKDVLPQEIDFLVTCLKRKAA